MVELKRSATPKRGYYVKMKLLNSQGRSNNNKNKSLCYRYLKWVVWASLSLYFFSSYFETNNLPKPNILHPTSRVLLQTNGTVLQNPTASSSSTFSNMRIYIYDLPPEYNTDWLSNKRCSNHLFAAEVAIHRALMSSEVRTLNPSEADFFFVPVYLSCNFSTVNGFPSMGHARPLLASAVQLISSTMPFWNRTTGSDHIFVASHDFGACFHSVEELAIADGIPEFMKKSVILQTFGVRYRHPCQAVENVVIPPYVSPRPPLGGSGKRDIFAFFRGKMEVHPKNISGQFYSRGVRSTIWHKYSRNRKFYLKRERYNGYQTEMRRSVFCLCPLGWAPWSPRLVESVALGCVPVIIADGIRLPFPETIQWSKISITVREKDVGKLGKILKHVEATNLTTIQRNLWDPVNRQAVLYKSKMEEGDATWRIVQSLSEKLKRNNSGRRSGE